MKFIMNATHGTMNDENKGKLLSVVLEKVPLFLRDMAGITIAVHPEGIPQGPDVNKSPNPPRLVFDTLSDNAWVTHLFLNTELKL